MRTTVITRFDWSPHTSRFTVRMSTSTHDIYTELVVQKIESQLKTLLVGTRISQLLLIWSDQSRPRTSISMDTNPSTTAIPSTHQTPPLHVPILNIPPSLSRILTRSDNKDLARLAAEPDLSLDKVSTFELCGTSRMV